MAGRAPRPRRWPAAIRTCLPHQPTCGTRTAAGASGGTFIALSRREVRTEYVERPFKVRQAFADLGTFPSCFGKARVDPVTKPTEPDDHGCSGGDTDGDDSDQHCDPFNRQRNPSAAQGSRGSGGTAPRRNRCPIRGLLSTERFPIPPQPQGGTGGAKATRCSGAVAAYLAARAETVAPASVRIDRAGIAAGPPSKPALPIPPPIDGVRQVLRGGLGAGEQGQGARAAGLPRCCADPHHEHRLPGRRQRHGSRCAVSGAPTVTALTRYLERPGHSAGANVPDSAPGRPWRPGSVGALSQSGRSSPSAPRPWASPGAYPGTRSESVPPSLWQPPGAGLVELQEAGDWQAPTMPAHYARHQLAARGAVAKLPLPGGPATACEQQQY